MAVINGYNDYGAENYFCDYNNENLPLETLSIRRNDPKLKLIESIFKPYLYLLNKLYESDFLSLVTIFKFNQRSVHSIGLHDFTECI